MTISECFYVVATLAAAGRLGESEELAMLTIAYAAGLPGASMHAVRMGLALREGPPPSWCGVGVYGPPVERVSGPPPWAIQAREAVRAAFRPAPAMPGVWIGEWDGGVWYLECWRETLTAAQEAAAALREEHGWPLGVRLHEVPF